MSQQIDIHDGASSGTALGSAPMSLHRLEQIVEQAIKMRGLQKKYFKDRTQSALIDAKKAEAILDIQLQRYAVAKELAAKILGDPNPTQGSFLSPTGAETEKT